MKSFLLAMTAIAPTMAMASSQPMAHRKAQEICLPHARYIKVIATTEKPITMFELLAMDATGSINYADASGSINFDSTDFNPSAIASQSSTLKQYGAGNAIDGDWTTFSHTNSKTGDFEYLKIDFGEEKYISEIQIENWWCGSPEDPKKCSCHLSYAKVWMYDDNDAWIAGKKLGDTCNQTELKVTFAPDTQYCEGVVGTPGDTLAAGVCQDDPDFISFKGGTCEDVAAAPIKDEICERDGILENIDENGNVYKFKHYCQVACGVCDPTVVEGIDEVFVDPALVEVEPTYSPTYLPSAQPVVVVLEPEIPGQIIGTTVEEEEGTNQAICLPQARYVKVIATTVKPIAMFELLAMDANGANNYAATDFNSLASASQSSTLGQYGAGNAIDGDSTTFSHTNSRTGDFEYLKIDFGEEKYISEIQIQNWWCGSPEDPKKCSCHLSYANVWIYDDKDTRIAGEQLGDTCNQTEVKVSFAPNTQYCEGGVGTPIIEEGPDEFKNTYDPTYVPSAQPVAVALITSLPPVLTGPPTTPQPITAQPVVGDVAVPAPSEPTYSPSYVPSAQPVATGATISGGSEVALHGYACEDNHETVTPTSCAELATRPDKDHMCYVYGMDIMCPVTCGMCVPNPETTAGAVNTATDSTPEASVSSSADESLSGHAYSVGDKCEDDQTFVSNKGITCKSFVYAENVHCRSPSGMHDEGFNALRYSDFCPKTCGMCAELVAAASNVKEEEEAYDKGVALGVGLSVSMLVAILLAWICCRGNYTGKSNNLNSSPPSEFRDDPAAQYSDDAGGNEMTGDSNIARISESVGETVAKTEIV